MAAYVLPKDKTRVRFSYPALMDKNFLQSEEWRKFQESVVHRTFNVSENNFRANIIEHKLPIVGRYFYVPRGPEIEILNSQFSILNQSSIFNDQIREKFVELIKLAKKNKAGWVRVEPGNQEALELIQGLIQGFSLKIRKAPHDMQPRQIFVIDISKPEEELLAQMKAKTRYNIKLSQRKNVACIMYHVSSDGFNRAMNSFIELVKITSERNKIKSHPENYYRKMLEIIPEKNLKLYTAEYQGKIIAANLISFYGDTATYLHGASDNKYRNVMAPFLLQWQAIKDAKEAGCKKYDLGGISTNYEVSTNYEQYETTNKNKLQTTNYKLQATKWAGITRFKLGFSPKTKPVEFPGSYDIVIIPWRYWAYRKIQKIKRMF